MSAQDYSIIEGAYFAGFEPSTESLTAAALLMEAIKFLSDISKL